MSYFLVVFEEPELLELLLLGVELGRGVVPELLLGVLLRG